MDSKRSWEALSTSPGSLRVGASWLIARAWGQRFSKGRPPMAASWSRSYVLTNTKGSSPLHRLEHLCPSRTTAMARSRARSQQPVLLFPGPPQPGHLLAVRVALIRDLHRCKVSGGSDFGWEDLDWDQDSWQAHPSSPGSMEPRLIPIITTDPGPQYGGETGSDLHPELPCSRECH
jgi:hypothetical protein